MADKEAVKLASFRSSARTAGIALISYGVGAGGIVGALAIVAGFIILGIKDYIEEKSEE